MSSGSGSTTVAGISPAGNSPFTMSQWQELEHQALIYKYLIAGLPVPPDLVLPIQKSFQMLSSPFIHHSPLGYCSMFGKKVDPEPGRCRRTDGKKWRCSKEAYPDSKYCERHMHRGRSRSRKPVESHSLSSAAAAAVLSSNSSTGVGGSASYQNLPLGAFGSKSGSDQTQLQLDSIPYAIPSKDYTRYLQGLNKPEAGDHSSFSESSSGNRTSPMYSTLGNRLSFGSTRASSYSPSKPAEISMLQPADYSQHSFLNCDFGLSQPGKQDSQNLRPFFELTTSKDSWSGNGLEDERVNHGSFSTTQLSISGPGVSSDFLSSSASPQGSNEQMISPSQYKMI